MKFYLAPASVIKDGPGGKPLNLVLAKKQVTEEEFNKVIDDFIDGSDTTQEAKVEGKKNLMDYLLSGRRVTVGSHCLSIVNR